MPAEPGTYRLEADVDHDGSLIGLSTRTRTAWTFESGETDTREVLPLIDVDYADLVDARSGSDALDLANSARADRRVRLDGIAAHQFGSQAPPVERIEVDVSYDDGATWQSTDVSHDGEALAATYRHPSADATTGYVSLRVVAEDGAGSRLEQTLVRAYRLVPG